MVGDGLRARGVSMPHGNRGTVIHFGGVQPAAQEQFVYLAWDHSDHDVDRLVGVASCLWTAIHMLSIEDGGSLLRHGYVVEDESICFGPFLEVVQVRLWFGYPEDAPRDLRDVHCEGADRPIFLAETVDDAEWLAEKLNGPQWAYVLLEADGSHQSGVAGVFTDLRRALEVMCSRAESFDDEVDWSGWVCRGSYSLYVPTDNVDLYYVIEAHQLGVEVS